MTFSQGTSSQSRRSGEVYNTPDPYPKLENSTVSGAIDDPKSGQTP